MNCPYVIVFICRRGKRSLTPTKKTIKYEIEFVGAGLCASLNNGQPRKKTGDHAGSN